MLAWIISTEKQFNFPLMKYETYCGLGSMSCDSWKNAIIATLTRVNQCPDQLTVIY